MRSDEYDTPAWVWQDIADFIRPTQKVWEPFPSSSRRSIRHLGKLFPNFIVTNTDFFETTWPENADILISNPPWSRKFEVLERLLRERKTFALLLPAWVVFSATMRSLQCKHEAQISIVVPHKRPSFIDPRTGNVVGKSTFDSVFVCHGIQTPSCITYCRKPEKKGCASQR